MTSRAGKTSPRSRLIAPSSRGKRSRSSGRSRTRTPLKQRRFAPDVQRSILNVQSLTKGGNHPRCPIPPRLKRWTRCLFPHMRVIVLNTGTEILLGDVINTHLSFIAREILPLGLRVERQI